MMRDARAIGVALLLITTAALGLASGCGSGNAEDVSVAATTTDDVPVAAQSPTPVREEGPPRLSLVVRGALVPGRPVPYRLTFENRTRDVLIPITAEASDGSGGATWARSVVGEVTYDEGKNWFVETPIHGGPQSSAGSPDGPPDVARALFRSAVFPGETIVHDFEVRYDHAGTVSETVRLLYHRLNAEDFDQLCYVRSGDGLPRRYEPVGNLQDRSARLGALLAGFYLRAPEKPESVAGSIELVLPGLPPAIVTRIERAGFEAERAMAADWAGGWLAGDAERSVLVTPAGVTRPLRGVPFEALQVIDDAGNDVSFCVTGAKREEIAPFFTGREIVPYKCLHVSVPRTDILPTLERMGAAGLSVRRVSFESRVALDVVREGAAKTAPPPPAASPAATPMETPTASTGASRAASTGATPAASTAASPARTPTARATKTPSPVPPKTPAPARTPAPATTPAPARTPVTTKTPAPAETPVPAKTPVPAETPEAIAPATTPEAAPGAPEADAPSGGEAPAPEPPPATPEDGAADAASPE